MTQTTERPPAPAATRRAAPDPALAAATGMVAAGMLLTTLPLRSIFTDWTWLIVSIGCALPYLVIVAGLRYRGPAQWWHSAAGLLASILVLLWVFVPQHLVAGVLPTTSSISDISDLVSQAHRAMEAEHAPLPSTPALRLLVAAALVGLVCLTDVLGVLLRRPLLAAAPLLEVLAVASATSSKSASPIWFAAAAAGFLLILLSGTRLQDRAWGPSVDGSAGRLGGGRRMAVTGIVAALVVPLVLPSLPTNLLARAAHHNGTGGIGNGSGLIQLNTLASLRGSLQQPSPKNLFAVQVSPGDQPFYIRVGVDDRFTNTGWVPSGFTFGGPDKTAVADNQYPVLPAADATDGVESFGINAQFTNLSLGGSALPILANPTQLRGTSGDGTWDSKTSTVSDVALKKNVVYNESLQQLAPTVAQLRATASFETSGDPELDQQLLGLPTQPSEVTALAARLTANLTTDYDKAKAISDYFTNGKNGFVYSLNAPADDGRAAIVSFLDKKTGYCQQYAAAAAVLMREAKLPTRVVVGFTHHEPDAKGLFTVTTSDAHAWVEVYFTGIGWVPFDPTPLAGADAARVVALPWAAHPSVTQAPTAEPTANKGPSGAVPSDSTVAQSTAAAAAGSTVSPVVWQVGGVAIGVIVLLVLIGFGPRALRGRQRRRRLDRARSTGNPEPLWLELAATATDRGVLWPSNLTVGQVPGWLSTHGVDDRGRAAIAVVAGTVERDRFSAQLVLNVAPESIAALDQALTRWGRRTDRRLSLVNRWLPKSLLGRHPRWRR